MVHSVVLNGTNKAQQKVTGCIYIHHLNIGEMVSEVDFGRVIQVPSQ